MVNTVYVTCINARELKQCFNKNDFKLRECKGFLKVTNINNDLIFYDYNALIIYINNVINDYVLNFDGFHIYIYEPTEYKTYRNQMYNLNKKRQGGYMV